MHKLNEDGKIYIGDWQWGDTILQRLEGPLGDGSISYPNGDHFAGFFHLSYAHINGPAYCARGRYKFVNGDVIEDCWINANDRLMGVYETHHPDGTTSIALWLNGIRWGLEVLPGDKPVAREYENGTVVRTHEGFSYSFDNKHNDACYGLAVTLADGTEVVQRFFYGDNDPKPHCIVRYPNGDTFSHYGDDVHLLRPWNGYGTYSRAADGKYIWCQWKEGEPVADASNSGWKYDDHGARRFTVQHTPYGKEKECECLIWPDGHIKWANEGLYDGPVVNDLPEGRGVFCDDAGRRYEGEFHEGYAHGQGLFTYPAAGIRQEGRWEKGLFQDPDAPAAPVRLQIHWHRNEWETGSKDKDEYRDFTVEAATGKLPISGWDCGVTVERITSSALTLSQRGKHTVELHPGESASFSDEIEGREWSDGCVFDGTNYDIKITWIP